MIDRLLSTFARKRPVGAQRTDAPATTQINAPPVAVLEATDATFDMIVLAATNPILVDFWAEWCQPCTIMSAYVGFLARDFAGRLQVVSVDVDENPETAARFNVLGLPTLIFFDAGREIQRMVGVATYDTLKQQITDILHFNIRQSDPVEN